MSLAHDLAHDLEAILQQRFGESIPITPALEGLERIEPIVKHRVIRRYSAKPVDSDLFDVLREIRLRLARARGVPPYVIFHDTTLRDMAEHRPATMDDLHEIYGVGARKAADFGDAFLDAIRTFRRPQT